MAKPKPVYTRKLADEEVKGGYILIQKGSLGMFPRPGKPFKFKVAGKYYDTAIKPVETWSMGPRKPQLSFRIDMNQYRQLYPLRWGHTVTIQKVKEGYYELI